MFRRPTESQAAALTIVVAVGIAGGSACNARSAAPEPPSHAAALGADTTWSAPSFPSRPYAVYAAAAAARSTQAVPVIVALHGFGGDGAGLVQYFHLKELADEHGAVVVLPTASRNRDGSTYWNAGGACCDWYDERPDDVAYLDAVLDDVATHFRVDAKRVYVVGHSNGGFMAYWYACRRAGRVAAIASLAGANLADASACRPTEPVAVLQVQGDADEIVPYAGGDFASPGLFSTLRRHGFRFPAAGLHTVAFSGARASAEAWAKLDGCSPDAEALPARDLDVRIPGPETAVARYAGCKAGGAELWTVHGGSHVPSLAPSFGEDVYAFLMAHPKR